jgi:hypothetical protein
LSEIFSAPIEVIMWFLSLILFTYCIIDLCMLYHPYIPGMKPTWSWCMIFWMLDSVGQYFVEDFCIYVRQGYWPITFFFLMCCYLILVL